MAESATYQRHMSALMSRGGNVTQYLHEIGQMCIRHNQPTILEVCIIVWIVGKILDSTYTRWYSFKLEFMGERLFLMSIHFEKKKLPFKTTICWMVWVVYHILKCLSFCSHRSIMACSEANLYNRCSNSFHQHLQCNGLLHAEILHCISRTQEDNRC